MYSAATLNLSPNVPREIQDKARKALAGYYAHCSALDDCVGQLLQTLRETGLADNTLVVFTSDHGDLLGAHGGFNKQQPYDESIRIPLLFHWPKGLGTTSRRLEALIGLEDIMPTILGLCRIPIPKAVDGLDFSRYLRGGQDPSDGAVVVSSVAPFGQWERRSGGREYRGLRTKRYTYVRDLTGPWLLFDNEADPYQLHNLAGDNKHAKLQAKLESQLTRRLKQDGDLFLPSEAYIRKWGYAVDEHGTVPYPP